MVKIGAKFEWNRAICVWIIDNFANFCTRYVTLSLDLWLLDLEPLQHFVCHMFKLRTKFERNRTIRGWIIDDLACLACNFKGWGTFSERFSELRAPNFTKLGKDMGRSSLRCKFVSEFGYLVALLNASGSKLSDTENDAKFRIFWLPCEN